MQNLLWLLLPVGVAIGWFTARRGSARESRDAPQDGLLGAEYIKGLNYLLNEQQDKAIDVFIRMLEVNSVTVETHLALGNLFRKRGEVDRAIRIHQNLVSRDSLSNLQRMDSLFELGQDYMKAGLFDRAESMFRELMDRKAHLSGVLPLLLDIYQQEKDWENAIDIAEQMGVVDGQPARVVISQYYCELAETEREGGKLDKALEYLEKASDYNPYCPRTSLIRGVIAMRKGDHPAALHAFRQGVERDIDLLPEVLDDLRAGHAATGTMDELVTFLRKAVDGYAGISPVLALADILVEEEGSESAASFIAGELGKRPSVRGLSRFIDLTLSRSVGEAHDNLLVLKEMTDQLLENKPVYRCGDCGFRGKALHWQCPGCKHWNTVKPIHGVQGE